MRKTLFQGVAGDRGAVEKTLIFLQGTSPVSELAMPQAHSGL